MACGTHTQAVLYRFVEIANGEAAHAITPINCIEPKSGYRGFPRSQAPADEIVFMDHGQIIEQAPVTPFFGAPRTERAKDFLQKILSKI